MSESKKKMSVQTGLGGSLYERGVKQTEQSLAFKK